MSSSDIACLRCASKDVQHMSMMVLLDLVSDGARTQVVLLIRGLLVSSSVLRFEGAKERVKGSCSAGVCERGQVQNIPWGCSMRGRHMHG
jgi:hypothetical protein